MKKFWSRVFRELKIKEDTKMKSCFCFQEGDDNERRFSTVAIQSLLRAIYFLS